MAIIRSKSQPHQTLTEFYTEAAESSDPTSSGIGREMLKWIDQLNSKLPEIEIWGLTSLYRLVLMTSESYEGQWYVIIIGMPSRYRVEYLIPTAGDTGKNAYRTSETKDLGTAVEMTIAAMEMSGGWGNIIV